jgi:hypothetical protein
LAKFAYRSGPRKKILVQTPTGEMEVASGFEKKVIEDLFDRKIPFSYEPDSLEIKLPLRGGHCVKCGAAGKDLYKEGIYTVDIRLDAAFPKLRYVECKGKLTSFERTRLKALYAAYGEKFQLYLLLQRDNYLNKGSKTRYSQWASSVGFTVAVGNSIPPEWYSDREGELESEQ